MTKPQVKAAASKPAVPEINPKDFLERTEAKIEELARSLSQASGDARVQAHLGLMELADTWSNAQSELNKQVTQLKRGATKARGMIDEAKVQAHLAKAEATDGLNEIRSHLKNIEQRLKGFAARQESQTRVALERLEKSCHDLSQKLR